MWPFPNSIQEVFHPYFHRQGNYKGAYPNAFCDNNLQKVSFGYFNGMDCLSESKFVVKFVERVREAKIGILPSKRCWCTIQTNCWNDLGFVFNSNDRILFVFDCQRTDSGKSHLNSRFIAWRWKQKRPQPQMMIQCDLLRSKLLSLRIDWVNFISVSNLKGSKDVSDKKYDLVEQVVGEPFESVFYSHGSGSKAFEALLSTFPSVVANGLVSNFLIKDLDGLFLPFSQSSITHIWLAHHFCHFFLLPPLLILFFFRISMLTVVTLLEILLGLRTHARLKYLGKKRRHLLLKIFLFSHIFVYFYCLILWQIQMQFVFNFWYGTFTNLQTLLCIIVWNNSCLEKVVFNCTYFWLLQQRL